MVHLVGTAPVTQEMRDYYKNKFHFEDVNFKTPNADAGEIIVTRNGVTKVAHVNDLLIAEGFDGIDDVLTYADQNWESDDGILEVL